MSCRTVCRLCLVMAENARRKNAATHAVWAISGEGSMTCAMHAQMLVDAGGFAFPLTSIPGLMVNEALPTAKIRGLVQAASLERRDAPRVAERAPVVITVDAAGDVQVERAPRQVLELGGSRKARSR